MDKILWLVLDTIRETCDRRKICEGCPCAGSYKGPEGRTKYYCAIFEAPSHWQTDIIRDNLEKRSDNE